MPTVLASPTELPDTQPWSHAKYETTCIRLKLIVFTKCKAKFMPSHSSITESSILVENIFWKHGILECLYYSLLFSCQAKQPCFCSIKVNKMHVLTLE